MLTANEILDTHTTKSGKVKQINLRERLDQLEIMTELPDDLPTSVIDKLTTSGEIVIHYVGSCRNDGNMLRPEQMLRMLEQQKKNTDGSSLQLGHVHRQQLILT